MDVMQAGLRKAERCEMGLSGNTNKTDLIIFTMKRKYFRLPRLTNIVPIIGEPWIRH